MPVDPAAFRRTATHVPSAVSVVTTFGPGGDAWGVTVGSLCPLSARPPLVLFCLETGRASHEVVTSSTRFLVHVLRDDQRDVAARFARCGEHGFGRPPALAYGLPAIAGVLARLSCVRHALMPGGDHTIVVGRVEDAETCSGAPLVYYQREYCAPIPLGLELVGTQWEIDGAGAA
jgi:flavin reductase ActVB